MTIARALLVIAIGASAAWAEATHVFPLTAPDLPRERRGTPERLTKAVADAMDAELSSVPIEDAAGLLDCDVEATSCLEAVARKLGGKQLVFGTIALAKGNRLRVTLTRFRPEGPDRQQQTYELTGEGESLPEELVRKARPLIGGVAMVDPRGRGGDGDRDTGGGIDDDDGDDGDDDDDGDPVPPVEPAAPPAGTVSNGTWMMLGGGAVAFAVGIGFRLSASGIADQVAMAPRSTPEDFARLTALEDKGQFRLYVGTGLMVAGGALVIASAVRAYVQKQPPRADADGELGVLPLRGGAAFTLTWGLR